jgi:uncharacterized membrane protein SpoIIM required for sporulation
VAAPLGEFVTRRRPSWDQLSALLSRLGSKQLKLEELDGLDRLYRQASADLAVAQSFYAGTDVHRFLNQLCARAYGEIYQSRRDRVASVRAFFAAEFPRAVREELRFVATAAALMAVGVLIGATTVALTPTGVALFVPDNIQSVVNRGGLWTDELNGNSSEIAIAILTNNLKVTFSAFALGASFGLGTVLTLVANGLSIGALLTFCFQHGLGWRLMEFMIAHGPVELSVISLTGGAGLMIGQALIDPGELPRGEAVRVRAGKAVRIVLGCAPFLALIGVVEGFISPGALFPAAAKVLLGVGLGAGFWGYLMRAGK